MATASGGGVRRGRAVRRSPPPLLWRQGRPGRVAPGGGPRLGPNSLPHGLPYPQAAKNQYLPPATLWGAGGAGGKRRRAAADWLPKGGGGGCRYRRCRRYPALFICCPFRHRAAAHPWRCHSQWGCQTELCTLTAPLSPSPPSNPF